MKREQSNKSTERILALLVLLLQGEYNRDEILMSIADYHRGATVASQIKMFERDLSTLERAGLHVERDKIYRGVVLYSVPPQQFRRHINDEPMPRA
jgi:hypothetical protein